MNRHQLAYFLSGFGILAFGCEAGREAVGGSSAASEMSAKDEYLASQAFAELPANVAAAARATLDAAGPLATHSLVMLYASPKFIQFASVYDNDSSCTPNGSDAVLLVISWAQGAIPPLHGETAATADTRLQKAVDAMAERLASPAVDVTQIDPSLTTLACGAQSTNDAGVTRCTKKLFTVPTDCENNTTGDDDDTTSTTATTGPMPLAPHAMLQHDAAEQSAALADLFRQADAVHASRGMALEWNDLRARFRAGISQAAKDTLREARRSGSATVRRDALAGRRFDEATKIVDAFVRGNIAPNVDAMNLVHASVATTHQGHLRHAGQDVFMGRRTGRRYLPGAAVRSATDDMFARVSALRANGGATPLIAATFDQRMISIHPYMDANGRTRRLMTDWMLLRDGFPPALMTEPGRAIALLPQNRRFARDARLEHITEGMRRTVDLIEQLA